MEDGYNNYIDTGHYLNYTRIQNLTDQSYNLAPRMHFCNTRNKAHWNVGMFCTMLMDTELEKSLGLGVDYPYE